MLYQLFRHRRAATLLEQIVTQMPTYPIFREVNGTYCIYVNGQQRAFASHADAQFEQLLARAAWLRAHNDHCSHTEVML